MAHPKNGKPLSGPVQDASLNRWLILKNEIREVR